MGGCKNANVRGELRASRGRARRENNDYLRARLRTGVDRARHPARGTTAAVILVLLWRGALLIRENRWMDHSLVGQVGASGNLRPLHNGLLLTRLSVLCPPKSVLLQMPRVLRTLAVSTPMLQRARTRTATGATEPGASGRL